MKWNIGMISTRGQVIGARSQPCYDNGAPTTSFKVELTLGRSLFEMLATIIWNWCVEQRGEVHSCSPKGSMGEGGCKHAM